MIKAAASPNETKPVPSAVCVMKVGPLIRSNANWALQTELGCSGYQHCQDAEKAKT